MKHISVLLNESIDGLEIKSGDVIVDGTLGGGGHTLEIIKRFGSKVKIICLDLDSDAIARSKKLIDETESNVVFKNIGFQDIDKVLLDLGIEKVDKVLLDLGLSSFQLEEGNRGFSFSKNEPLLMTMKKNPEDSDVTAYSIVNTWDEETIADIIFGFGEERFSRKIAKAIIDARKEKDIVTTFDLVEILEKTVGKYYRGKKINPSTRTFQALRIATNSELSNLDQVVQKGFSHLSKGGRMAIISFHSLEDRIVKKAFVDLKEKGLATVITKKPIVPSPDEIKSNPRSRSSKLRLIEKNI
ncbi:MAG: 16S rRNA (cytosine(1402)-N(4))-methyltransferase RsmH [Candidatus Nomurabacteria bacterium]|nr:16S rRNA (cytosine(1402)-N(4))-methyltransferase RsmH [Candidatus Nomurabacteria bacterium]